MRNGDLAALTDMLRERNARKHDVVVSAQTIHASRHDEHGIVLFVEDADPVGVEPDGTFVTDFLTVVPNDVMDDGLSTRLGIPRAYYRRMRNDAPGLLAESLNVWLDELGDTPQLLRTFRSDDGPHAIGRAFLSDRFECIDDFDVVMGVLDGVRSASPGAEVSGCDITDKKMRLRITAPDIALNIADLLTGYQVYGRSARDFPLMWAGIAVENSEVGAGAFTLSPRAVVQVCTNGMTRAVDAIRRVHLGSRMDQGVINWSDETRRAQIDLIRNQARDAVATFLNVDYLAKFAQDMRAASGQQVEQPSHAVQFVAQALGYNEEEQDNILAHFYRSGDNSALGLAQALTLHAQTLDSDRAADAEDQALSLALAAVTA